MFENWWIFPAIGFFIFFSLLGLLVYVLTQFFPEPDGSDYD